MPISKIERAGMPGGAVLQVVSISKTDNNTTTSTSFIDLPGMSVTITPTSATSKILVMMSTGCAVQGTAGTVLFNLIRNSTNIAQPAAGSFPATINFYPGGSTGSFPFAMHFLDSPATTAAVTYKIQWRVDGGTGYFNRHQSNTDYSAPAAFTVMEIAA